MKKSLLLLLVAMSVCLGGFAQKGRQAVGVDVPLRICNKADLSMGVGFKYQYNVSDYICVEPIIQYYWEGTGDYFFNFVTMLNSKFYFIAPNQFRPYGSVGVGICGGSYFNWDYDYDDYNYEDDDYDDVRFIAQAGIGCNCKLSNNWSLQFEAGYQLTYLGNNYNHSGLYLSTGFAYNF